MLRIKLSYSFLLILWSILFAFNARSENIDSLKYLLSENNNTAHTHINIKLANEYILISKDLSLQYGYEAIISAVKSKNKLNLADAYKCVGNIHYLNSKVDSAILYNLKSFEIYKTLNDSTGQAKTLNNLGIFNAEISNFSEAIKYHLYSLELKQLTHDSTGIASTYNNIGSIYYKLRLYPKAISYFQNSINISKKLTDQEGINSSTINIGLIEYETGNYKSAINYFTESLKFCVSNNDISCISECYANLGDSYMSLGDYNNALDFFLKSLNINNSYSINNPFTTSKIGNIYELENDTDKAIEYFRKSIELAEIPEDNELIQSLNLKLSNIFAKKGEWETAYSFLIKTKANSNGPAREDTLLVSDIKQLKNDTITDISTDENNISISNNLPDKISRTTILLISISVIIFLLIIIAFTRTKKK